MAAAAEMGEIDEVHSKEDVSTEPILNGDGGEEETTENEDSQSDYNKKQQQQVIQDAMEVDDDVMDDEEEDDEEVESVDNHSRFSEDDDNTIDDDEGHSDLEVHEIIDDEDEEEEDDDDEEMENGVLINKDEPIELNDSGDGDVMIIDEPKENGSIISTTKNNDELEVIELDVSSSSNVVATTTTPVKKKQKLLQTITTPRRSVRNINKQKSYIETDKDDLIQQQRTTSTDDEESDIEEILPQDPLAMSNDKIEITRANKKPVNATTTTTAVASSTTSSSSTIVVKDTKRLVEIAAKSNNNQSGNKKEPTLVIIDTNSILSGRGPVPITKSTNSTSSSTSYSTLLPMALPAQGMYPANMRATITPIPLNSTSSKVASASSSSSTAAATTLAPVLPTLTDDMFVVEAPSFIVPYVYEKPPMKDLKDFVQKVADQINKDDDDDVVLNNKKDDGINGDNNDVVIKNDNDNDDVVVNDGGKKAYSYFDSPVGKFFIDIGFNLVQEFVQSDLLRQQKKKRDREGGQNPTTNKTIHSLLKNLEFSKENNEPYKIQLKKCEFCHFKTESGLVMAHHLETPHTKNYVYKCNFCTYEARSPHDILFHMEAEHAVRGRLERAPSFHQCPNCPFEDNQKGKLTRHLVACMRKFKPERNLDPPIDWEPPAKIPRVPKTRQGLNVSAYQAMKSSQLQFLSKMQLLNANPAHPLHRGRGRPTLGATMKSQTMLRPPGMVYKQQTMSGGSVLVPTNYQLSGNQVYQVVGGQEFGGRLSHPGHMAFVPNIPSASSTVSIQSNQSSKSNKTVHQPSISITPLPRATSSSPNQTTTTTNQTIQSKPGDTNSKNSFVICEICDGYIKDLEQLRNHMQWIHKVKIHPKMIYNRPPLNCQKCQFRFFTDQGLERHLLGSHGLVTSSMQDAANKSKDSGRCPVCGRVYQWKLLNHVARDHNMTLKPAHLSYKCTVCTATFGMYKQFENHVYSAHSVVAKRVMDKKQHNKNQEQMMKPLKINDEITIIPQPAKPIVASTSKESNNSPSSSTGSTNSRNSTPSTSKNDVATAVCNSPSSAPVKVSTD